MGAGGATEPTADVIAGYHAPYPEPELTIGSRAFTQLLPTRPDNPMLPDNFEAWKVLETYDRPLVTVYSDRDVVAPEGWKPLVERMTLFGRRMEIQDGAYPSFADCRSDVVTPAWLDFWLYNRIDNGTDNGSHETTREVKIDSFQ